MSLRNFYKNIMNDHASSEGVQLALAEMKSNANPNCKKCYGRGYIGRNTTTGLFHACRCVKQQTKAQV